MKIDYSTSLYGLIGDPVEKSLSPDIHNLSFSNNEINSVYLAFQVKSEELQKAVEGMKSIGVKGFNVTIPHKVDIIKYLDELDEEAEMLGAVNTVKNENGVLKGYNTDGRGFIELLKSNGVEVEGSKIIILGAGGASRGISMLLAKEGAAKINIVNRTEDKAVRLKEEISGHFSSVDITTGLKDDYTEYDLLINTTSVGMYPNDDEVPFDIELLSDSAAVADIIYKPLRTKLLKEADSKGHKIVEGLGMLINQAILSEEIWLDRELDKKSIIDEISKQFK